MTVIVSTRENFNQIQLDNVTNIADNGTTYAITNNDGTKIYTKDYNIIFIIN